MKHFFVISFLLLAQSSLATILEINEIEKKVIYHPTPELQLSLVDAGDSVGLLVVGLDYDSKKTKNEFNEIQNKYLNYKIQYVSSQPVETVMRLEIEGTDFVRSVNIKNGMLGPYINSNFELNREQINSIKKIADITSAVKITLLAKSTYTNLQTVEEYKVDSKICSSLNVSTVQSLILNLSALKRPEAIKYNQTFDSLKRSILENCFDVGSINASHFNELMSASVSTKQLDRSLAGVYLVSKEVEKSFSINPFIRFDFIK